MNNNKELSFFLRLMQEYRLPCNFVSQESLNPRNVDGGIRRLLYPEFNESKSFKKLLKGTQENTVYKLTDEFFCSYVFFLLPEHDNKTVLIIGPYTEIEFTHSKLLHISKEYKINPKWLPTLEMYFSSVTYVPDEHIAFTALQVLGEAIWGADKFKRVTLQKGALTDHNALFSPFTRSSDNTYDFNIQIIEKRYEAENRLMEAVRQGKIHSVEKMLSGFTPASVEHRAAEPTRNAKNYLIILNTLMRKATELGGVHPLHIDRLSSEFAKKIENITSWSQIQSLCRKMAEKYCELAVNHSLKGYSPTVQKVLTLIDFDLTANLSLKAVAEYLKINASYLSALFKRETGQTLTDFVNTKRVERAEFLLNTTDMPVSLVAQHCGIPDNNYFTKIFKKHTGKTPRQFRQS